MTGNHDDDPRVNPFDDADIDELWARMGGRPGECCIELLVSPRKVLVCKGSSRVSVLRDVCSVLAASLDMTERYAEINRQCR